MSLKTDLQSIISDLMNKTLADLVVTRDITYVALTATTFDRETLVQGRTETSTALKAVRSIVSEKQMAAIPGAQVGDRKYLIAKTDLSADPSKNDRITDGSDELEVYWFKLDPLDLLWVVMARNV